VTADNISKEAPYFAPGNVAEKPFGVLYQGDYQHPADGTAVAVRLHARALAEAGFPVLLKPFTSGVMSSKGTLEPLHAIAERDDVRGEVGDLLETNAGSLFPSIKHLVVHRAQSVSQAIMRGAIGPLDHPEFVRKARKALYEGTVLFSVWERDRIDPKIARELKRVKENWVPCEHNAQLLRKFDVENVRVIPHPFDPEDPLCQLTKREPRQYRTDLRSKRFYSIGRWEPRKNQHLMLRAFCQAFSPGDDAFLTLKSHGNWEGYSSFEAFVPKLLQEFPQWSLEALNKHVVTIREQLRRDQIVRLHFENNIYLAPSCGEAWCLPAFEAKTAGNRLIHTPYGGTQDFGSDADWGLYYQMREVPSSYGWEEEAQWADVSVEELSQAMRNIQVPGKFMRTVAFEDAFSLKAVGQKMAEALLESFEGTTAGEWYAENLF